MEGGESPCVGFPSGGMMDDRLVLPVDIQGENVHEAKDADEDGGVDGGVGFAGHGVCGFFFRVVEGVLADDSGVGRRIHGWRIS